MKHIQRILKIAPAIFFVFISHLAQCQPPAGYYNAAQGLTGPELKTALHNIIKSHTALSYSALWNAFISTDKDLFYENDGTVLDIYSENPNGPDPYNFNFGNQCGSYNGEGSCYNREHSFPASWFNDASPMYTDLFHLYPTDGYVNNRRSNYPYGVVSNPTWTSQNGGKLGPSSFPGYSGTVFEPIDEFKGDLARGYFYMVTCYEDKLPQWASSCPITDGSTYPAFVPWVVELLLQWHSQDPPNAKEIARNEAVYQKQNNRNPFIDHPEWVYSIWGTSGIVENPVNFTATGESVSSIRLSWQLNSNGNEVLLAYNTTSIFGNPTGNYVAGQTIPGGGTVLYSGFDTSFVHTGLNQQRYYYKIWSKRENRYSLGQVISGTPLLPEPSNYPSNFTSSGQTATTITLSWIDAGGEIIPYNYYIKAAPEGTNIQVPTDGTIPVNDQYNKIVGYGVQTVSFDQLTPNTLYRFAIFPFNNNGVHTDYKTDGNYPTTSALTLETQNQCVLESFQNIPANSGLYSNRTWVGDNGQTWTATSARTDQTINGRAICFKGYVASCPTANGIGDLTVTTLFPLNDENSNLQVYVNEILVGTVPISQTPVRTTLSNINIPGEITVKISSDGVKRAAIDDLSWTCYTQTGIETNRQNETIFPNPLAQGSSLMIINAKNEPTILEIYNLMGERLLQYPLQGKHTEIDTGSLPKGVFICILKSNSSFSIHRLQIQ
ncbi:MAG TPA: endonuclease [Salinivirgaceae bacterium]|nr:endonuclease [Salinivirgaceae bacterium]